MATTRKPFEGRDPLMRSGLRQAGGDRHRRGRARAGGPGLRRQGRHTTGGLPVRLSAAEARPTLIAGLVLWAAPVVLFALWLGWSSTFTTIGLFFAKLALVTFGGAYAVLAYVAQQAVDIHQWLSASEMLTGLGLAETTPGPLILVLQFVAFLAGFREPGPFTPMIGGLVGGSLALWVTFVPCFLWIFLCAPYVDRLRHVRWLNGALSAITAAVVGVILNLALWFGLHVVFAQIDEQWIGPIRLFVPLVDSLDPAALSLSVLAAFAVLRFRLGLLPTLAGAAIAVSHGSCSVDFPGP
ncbi:MAG: chromate transporter [Rhodospirillales bacterium]|nr:chromate transporter [Rhodospirillales bacterium]